MSLMLFAELVVTQYNLQRNVDSVLLLIWTYKRSSMPGTMLLSTEQMDSSRLHTPTI